MNEATTTLGLRIDVDTLRGTRKGVPRLVEMLGNHRVCATFFFSVGPDNMGRHLWRLLRPAFMAKMLRSRAPSLYGWSILLRGTLWPGPRIAACAGDCLRAAARAGHEVGLHAWDHHAWQVRGAGMSREKIKELFQRGRGMLEQVTGRPVRSVAAPAWRITETGLLAEQDAGFVYASDCRGSRLFYPRLRDGTDISVMQVPTTLPTYDEVIGRDGVSDHNYNRMLLDAIRPRVLNVLTIHAEVEGIAKAELFSAFLFLAREHGIRFLPLGEIARTAAEAAHLEIRPAALAGRDGEVGYAG